MSTAPPNPSLDIVAEMFPLHEWKRPLCLMFDEMQNVIKPQVDVLEPLHLGTHGLPVVSVLAGLANTHAILGKHGLNHIADNATHKLGVLAFEEAAEAAEMFLDGFRIDRTSVGIDWPAEVAATSDGWPRHLHNSLQTLVQELLTANGRLADMDADAVRRGVRARRARSYWDRIESSELEGSKILLTELMQRLPDEGLERHEIVDEIEACADSSGPSGKRLPEGFTATLFLDRLIAKGALQSDGAGKLICPIPGLQDFMAHGFAMPLGPYPLPKRSERRTNALRPS